MATETHAKWPPYAWALLVGLLATGLYVSSKFLGPGTSSSEDPWWLAAITYSLTVCPAMALAFLLSTHNRAQHRLQQEMHQRQLQLQAEESILLLGRLASSIAHEVRNPLNNIRLLVDDLKEVHSDNDDIRYIIERLNHNSQRINHAVELVYRLARPANLRTPLEGDIFADLLTTLEQVKERLQDSDKQRVVIVTPPSLQRLHVSGDGECLQTIFENLIINSLRSAREAPVYVDVSTGPEPGRFTVAMFNEGALTSDFTVPDIADFDRLRPSHGLGLGIIIVNQLVKQMNMELLYASDEDVVSFRVTGKIHLGLFGSDHKDSNNEENSEHESVPRFDSR